MIALLLLAQAAVAPTLGALDRQALPARGCAAYLWSRADRRLVAMVTAEPAMLRIAPDGRQTDFARESQTGAGTFGLPDRASYRRGDVAATLEMRVEARADMGDGALIPEGVLSLSQGGGDMVIVPVAGLVGCRSAPG